MCAVATEQPANAQLSNYGVLKAQLVERRTGSTTSPHYQIHAVAGRDHFRIALTLSSQIAPAEVQVAIFDGFQHRITAMLQSLEDGLTPLSPDSRKGLDYIRSGLFNRERLQNLTASQLAEQLETAWSEVSTDPASRVYAFGNFWGPEDQRDRYFGFHPGRGVHNLHMNQGSAGRFTPEDGVYQDGGLMFEIPARKKWWAFFVKFQSQSWTTNDVTGRAPDLELSTLPAESNAPPPVSGGSDAVTGESSPPVFAIGKSLLGPFGWIASLSAALFLVLGSIAVWRHVQRNVTAAAIEVPTRDTPAAPVAPNLRVFISYRRQDGAHARLIRDRLLGDTRFMKAEVFHDVQSLRAGEEYRSRIRKSIDESDAVIALIGPAWIARAAELQEADDVLRLELTAALARAVPVLPITVGGVTLPDSSTLPKDVAPLLERNVLDLPDAYYEEGARKLLDRLNAIQPTASV